MTDPTRQNPRGGCGCKPSPTGPRIKSGAGPAGRSTLSRIAGEGAEPRRKPGEAGEGSIGEAEIALHRANAAHLAAAGLYDPGEEHDACGVGFIAAIDGRPRREVVALAIEALKAVWHRGAVDADGKTGDGAGIHVEIPQDFFREHVKDIGHQPRPGVIAVGMIFLPRTDLDGQERCRSIVETEILNGGHAIYGWRQVPINIDVIGDKANATRPEIEQIMIAGPQNVAPEDFERDLYVLRRRIEKRVIAEQVKDFYICSLSCRSIIYKGMFLAEQLTAFYPDLIDERFASRFAIYHQRYSTNTFPTWHLAQPFRILAHNGEINTLRGNINWMKSHETRLASALFAQIEDLKPVIQSGGSDSAALDAAFELLVRAGRPLPAVKTLMVPEAVGDGAHMPRSHRDMYSYSNSVMEPWDGPAALAMTDGHWVLAGMDRNGLRPLRYAVTAGGLLVAGSEAGMIRLDETGIVEKGRLGPGQMIGVDLDAGRLYRDREIKDLMAARRPYGEWVREITPLDSLIREARESVLFERDELRRRQVAVGWSLEDLEMILPPMIEDGKEAVGSMGDDTPLAVLSDRSRGLHHFFRQNFSQVTNPPIDSLRERRVMTLKTRLGNLGNILDEDESQCRLLQLDSPVLSNAEFAAMSASMADTAAEIDCTFTVPPEPDDDGMQDGMALREAIARIRREAEDAVRGGCIHVILSDERLAPERAAIPMILATGAVHSHLVRQQLRTFTSLNVRSAECLDIHYFAVLIGVGATTVNAYLAQETIAERCRRGLVAGGFERALAHYKEAVDQGLLKVMSKMGIAVISSYRGAYNFEAVGLSRTLVADFFPGMPSRISGIGLAGIERKALSLHYRAFAEDFIALPVGGFYRYRRGGERHAFDPSLIHTLQNAVANDSYATYKRYAEAVRQLPPAALRDLLDFKRPGPPISVDEVESITEIRKRLVAPGISFGALGAEAHETLSIAMNRIGAKSDSGEGGEDPARLKPRANGDNPSSAIKQVASGRFGVTAEYLAHARELEIKISQGSKPGEGGQLPGLKVSPIIARLRHSTPGVSLISPPPHHDIYSIEDLAQLIYDLKQVNPEAKVCVKLVARSGIGTIAAGVAKARADVILISGHAGGTGASPQSSIKFAGVPWEMGLSEVHQVLVLNRLRHRVRLRVDGGIKTGRDVVIAAILGAEEFGLGTASLVAMGCILVRQCHSNTCPVGICTQDERLREKFTGTPEKVVNLFSFVAEEVREILASLGARSLNEIVGRTHLLAQISRGSPHLDDLDLNPILAQADPGEYPRYCTLEERNEVPDTLDAQMLRDLKPLFDAGEKMQLTYNVRNTHRAVGTRLSSLVTRRFGMKGLQPGHITVRLRGSAGQSLGAFAVEGLRLEVFGDANDYVGKGLSGGTIVLRPPTASPLLSHQNAIIGNTALYGATGGKMFAAGQAGERFAVRNSGAETVVEGCGSNGCEYITGGTAVILGPVGANFAAGMTGGMAFVYDPEEGFASVVNPETVIWQRVATPHWGGILRALVEEHARETQSRLAAKLIADWDEELPRFWQVVPKEMLTRLAEPLSPQPVRAQAGGD
ncbi:MAG TPA: glutamate synthase large subunit [Stellaceae bacterium]|nr:glutamate synthase large subunit [Stellaceae bacterium]